MTAMLVQNWSATLKGLLLIFALAILTACGGNQPGIDRADLLGTWELDSDQPLSPTASLSGTRITYNDDGTSNYQARLNITEANAPVSTMAIQAEVQWRLEETILTRDLQSVIVIPVTGDGTPPSDDQTTFAKAYQDGFNGSPPAQFVVEVVNDAQLVLLDPVTGDILVFNRVAEVG